MCENTTHLVPQEGTSSPRAHITAREDPHGLEQRQARAHITAREDPHGLEQRQTRAHITAREDPHGLEQRQARERSSIVTK